jgi:transcriptional regulator with GAF, ATPase, and Fis domain
MAHLDAAFVGVLAVPRPFRTITGGVHMSDDAAQRSLTRQLLTATTFVELVDALVGDFDVIDVLTGLASRCVELLGASAAGILLADNGGQLRVIGASNEQVRLLELFQLQNKQGPCLDCYVTGSVVIHSDLERGSPWPEFAAESVAEGFPSVCAVPLRLKTVMLGCLNLFMSEPVELSDADVILAQALADVASIAIVQDQATREAALREGHLTNALTSRIVIEQAKGMIAERGRVDMDAAFAMLRTYARNNNCGLTDVAEAVVSGKIVIDAIVGPSQPPPRFVGGG